MCNKMLQHPEREIYFFALQSQGISISFCKYEKNKSKTWLSDRPELNVNESPKVVK